MTKQFKYDYYNLAVIDWIKEEPEDREGTDGGFGEFRDDIKPHIEANRQHKLNWNDEWNTHNPDGSYTLELTFYLNENAEYLKIWGYGYPVDTIQIWNQQEYMYQVLAKREVRVGDAARNIEIGFSDRFRAYLEAESYATLAIEQIEEEIQSDAYRLQVVNKLTNQQIIEHLMQEYWTGFKSGSPECGTIIEWKIAQREESLMDRGFVEKTFYPKVY